MLWTARLCRICAQIGEISHPILENDVHDRQIAEKIKKILHLDVSFISFPFPLLTITPLGPQRRLQTQRNLQPLSPETERFPRVHGHVSDRERKIRSDALQLRQAGQVSFAEKRGDRAFKNRRRRVGRLLRYHHDGSVQRK